MEVADMINSLHRAGWSVGCTALAGPAGRMWIVSGINGENQITADGATELEAWRAACEQARACGMLWPRRGPR
jgi:hypothetical protein